MGINHGCCWNEARLSLQYAGHALTTNDVPDPWIGLEINPTSSGRSWNGMKQEMQACRARRTETLTTNSASWIINTCT
jgi:hypothetical protein